jgi:hypothetical protein
MYVTNARRSRPSMLRSVLVLAALAAGVSACSSSGHKAADTTLAATTTTARATTTTAAPTTVAETTTTVAETTTTVAETTTTLPPVPTYALTGVENPDPAVAARPALVVKIDNAPGARPQSGFNEADIVFEEIVNDNLTRFAMVFQSGNANPVGPIRSGRIQDINLFSALDHPLFAWSGGNVTVTNAINASELVNIGPNVAPVYFRTKDKKVPHNLYSSTDALYSLTPAGAPPAKPLFQYRHEGDAAGGTPSPGLAVQLDSIDVRWDWDPAQGLYMRQMEGRPHGDALSGQVSTNNVVVLVMDYLPGISESPDAQTIGTNEAFVLTGGNAIHGTWTRNDEHEPFTLTADDGTPILLQPGRTFVELPRAGHTLVIPG